MLLVRRAGAEKSRVVQMIVMVKKHSSAVILLSCPEKHYSGIVAWSETARASHIMFQWNKDEVDVELEVYSSSKDIQLINQWLDIGK